jgi:hypothetical protein
MNRRRIATVATSNADDAAFRALADVAEITKQIDGVRIVGGHMASLLHAPPETLAKVLVAGPKKYFPNTLTDDASLRRRLGEIRATGIARPVEELMRGAFSVASPVRAGGGDVVAAVSVIANIERVNKPQFVLGYESRRAASRRRLEKRPYLRETKARQNWSTISKRSMLVIPSKGRTEVLRWSRAYRRRSRELRCARYAGSIFWTCTAIPRKNSDV